MTWSIIRTAGNRERRLAEALNEKGFPAFLPTKRSWRHLRGRASTTSRPVMPGYVFAVIPPQDIHDFKRDGAIRILPVSPWLQEDVDKGVLAWQIAERYGEYDDLKPYMVPAGKTARGQARNRRSRRIKRLMRIVENPAQEQHLAA